MSKKPKQYGLVVPQSKKKLTAKDVFTNESDSDDDRGQIDYVKKALQRDAQRGMKRQTKLDIARALDNDPTVYQYDEVYDDMKKKETETKKAKVTVEQRKPKYMGVLIKTAERRKLENERRMQRTVQLEREAEGEQFKDKEEFITSAYKAKLEEMRKAEEEEKREKEMEDLLDVTKQKDLGGFYRHLYRETVDKEKPSTSSSSSGKSSKS